MGLRELLCCMAAVQCMFVGVPPPVETANQDQSSPLMCSNACWWFSLRSPLSHMSTTDAVKSCFGKSLCFMVWMLRRRFFSKDVLWEVQIHLERARGDFSVLSEQPQTPLFTLPPSGFSLEHYIWYIRCSWWRLFRLVLPWNNNRKSCQLTGNGSWKKF